MNKKKPLAYAIAAALAMVAVDATAFEINPRGRFHLDYAFHDSDATDLDDTFRNRRSRLGLSGTIEDDWAYQIEYDFAENDVAARDIYLRYTGWDAGNLTIGQFKVPFSLEELTSSNNITFIERALPVGMYAQSRRTGVGFAGSGESFTYSVMGFGQGIGSSVRSTAGSSNSGDEGIGLGGRMTFTPVNRDGNLLHLGIAVTTEEPENKADNQVRFRNRPESRPTGIRLIDTGTISDVDRINQVGLEAGWQTGPFSIQGEWMRSDVNRNGGNPDYSLDGYYINASYVLTGESRGYRGGVFRGISPERSSGAWEVAARYSHASLDDGDLAGGKESNVTLGVNWYANSRIRLMANYIMVDSERGGVSDDPNIFLVRAQVAF